jgi:FMN phosphatase YigB (HAD superfamily)
LERKKGFLKPYPNVAAVLDELRKRGYVLGVVTDAPKMKACQRLLAMHLERHFQFVLGFEDTGAKKQTGLPLKLALEYLRKELPELASSEVLMVGDSVERDLCPAKNLVENCIFSLWTMGRRKRIRRKG